MRHIRHSLIPHILIIADRMAPSIQRTGSGRCQNSVPPSYNPGRVSRSERTQAKQNLPSDRLGVKMMLSENDYGKTDSESSSPPMFQDVYNQTTISMGQPGTIGPSASKPRGSGGWEDESKK